MKCMLSIGSYTSCHLVLPWNCCDSQVSCCLIILRTCTHFKLWRYEGLLPRCCLSMLKCLLNCGSSNSMIAVGLRMFVLFFHKQQIVCSFNFPYVSFNSTWCAYGHMFIYMYMYIVYVHVHWGVWRCVCVVVSSQLGIPRGLIELDLQLSHHSSSSFLSLKATHTHTHQNLNTFWHELQLQRTVPQTRISEFSSECTRDHV